MKVLVTGATGRVGANVVRRMLDAGAGVRAMVMPGDPQASKMGAQSGLELVEASLADQSSITAACSGVTHVIHLATQMARGDTAVDRYFDINTLGTVRILEAIVANGGVDRIVMASTDGTYCPGNPPELPLTELSPQNPSDYYGVSKLINEKILESYSRQYDIPFVTTRFCSVVSPEEAVSKFTVGGVRALLSKQGKGRDSNIWQLFDGYDSFVDRMDEQIGGESDDTPISLRGPGGEPWAMHLIDVRDVAEGVWLATEKHAALGEAFNFGGPHVTSFDEGCAAVEEVTGISGVSAEMPVTWKLEMSIEKAKKLLGFIPEYDFRMTARAGRDTVRDYIPARVES